MRRSALRRWSWPKCMLTCTDAGEIEIETSQVHSICIVIADRGQRIVRVTRLEPCKRDLSRGGLYRLAGGIMPFIRKYSTIWP